MAEFNLFRLGQTLTIYLPTSQVPNPDAMRQFAILRDQSLPVPPGVEG